MRIPDPRNAMMILRKANFVAFAMKVPKEEDP
jgi:hypothetical protein